jgi:hypothetical protein
MSYPGARARAQAPVGIDVVLDLPLDPATGWLGISGTVAFVPAPVPPTVIIYSSAAAEAVSAIPGLAPPASLTAIYARLLGPPNLASQWIQIHLGPAVPLAGAVPFLVGDIITPPGGNTQWIPPDEINRTVGYFVVTSSTQDTYTPVVALSMITRALGRP